MPYLRKAFLRIFESAHLFRKFSVAPRNSNIGFFNHLWRLHDFNLLLTKILFDGLFKFNLINFGGTGLLLNRRGFHWRRKTLLRLLKKFKDERRVYFWLDALRLRGWESARKATAWSWLHHSKNLFEFVSSFTLRLKQRHTQLRLIQSSHLWGRDVCFTSHWQKSSGFLVDRNLELVGLYIFLAH